MDGQTPGRLGGVQHKGNSTFPAQGRDALHRQDEAEHVGHMVTNDGPHRLVQLALKGADLSLRIKERACSHPDIDTKGVERSGDGVVLIAGDHHGVPGLQQGMNGEIQPMGGVGGEHHLFWALHLKELRRCLTAEKGGFCRPHGGNMPAAARGCQAPHCGRNRPRHGGRFL